mgnify:CR=1 FL=1
MRKIRIPSLDQMYEDVKKVVLEAQGDKAFIDTDPKDCVDTIHTHKYSEVSDIFEEEIVFGVRVKDGDLQIIPNPWMRTYHNRPTDEEYADDNNWHSVKNSDAILYVPTIFNIAENIREYID